MTESQIIDYVNKIMLMTWEQVKAEYGKQFPGSFGMREAVHSRKKSELQGELIIGAWLKDRIVPVEDSNERQREAPAKT